jgi:hypothetical protein
MSLRIGIGTNLRITPSLFSWQAYWTTRSLFWADKLSADGLNLDPKVGTGGILKDFICSEIANVADYLVHGQPGVLSMTDNTATYEYYYEFIIADKSEVAYKNLITNGATADTTKGFMLRMYISRLTMVVCDGSARQNLITADGTDLFLVGLNKVLLRFNCPAKTIYVNINGTEINWSHTLAGTLIGDASIYFYVGNSGASCKFQKPIYLTVTKNSIITHEFIFTDRRNITTLDYYYETIAGIASFRVTKDKVSTQSLINPYKDGYNIYVKRKYNTFPDEIYISPKGEGGGVVPSGYDFLETITTDDLGYDECNYIELPDLAIFDTTDRTYWKVAIEADPYYLGAGYERWFHKSWLNFTWLNTYLEDDYKYRIVIRNVYKTGLGMSNYLSRVNDIILADAVYNYAKTERFIYEPVSFSDDDVVFFKPESSGLRTYYHTVGDKVLMIEGDYVKVSLDKGLTYNTGVDAATIFAAGEEISRGWIREDGVICVFGDMKTIAYSDDDGATFTACTYLGSDGNPYTFHVPVNAAYPGSYFNILGGIAEYDGILVIGNYTNTSTGKGASSINLWYSLDGITWKVFYTFGQNPVYKDDGTVDGGTTGNLLGDALNPLITRHIQSVNVGDDGHFYCGMGDDNTRKEMHFLDCVYDADLDSWTVTDLLDDTTRGLQRYRTLGIYEKDGYLYYGVDQSTGTFVFDAITYDIPGIYKCLKADINDPSKHILLQDTTGKACYGFIRFGKYVIYGTQNTTDVYISSDYGETWTLWSKPADFNDTTACLWHNSLYNYFMDYSNEVIYCGRI